MRNDTRPRSVLRTYPHWFYLPAAIIFGVFFLVPDRSCRSTSA